MLFTNIRLNTFQAGIFKGGHRFFKLVSITPRHKRFIYIILCGFIIILFALLSKFYQILIQEEKRHYLDNEEYYIKSLDIENFYFFFNKYFKDFFLNNKILKLLQLSYTIDNYKDLYLIDLYNINCLYE